MMASLLPGKLFLQWKHLGLLPLVRFLGGPKSGLSTSGHEGNFEDLCRREYWETRYQKQDVVEHFDWFLNEDVISSLVCYSLFNFAANKDFAEPAITMHKRTVPIKILDLGCGISALPQRYYEWTPFPVEVHCLDFSPAAVSFQMKMLLSTRPGHLLSSFNGVCANVCSLPYKDNLFHLIVDKGTMDALLKDPVNGSSNACIMLSETERVLCKGGLFLQVTDEDPDSRLPFLETHAAKASSWNCSVLSDNGHDGREYFVYMFSK